MKLASWDAGPVVIGVAVVAPDRRRREHIGGAGDGATSGAERAAHDRANGSAAAVALRCAGRLPGHCAGDRVPITRVPGRLADAVGIVETRRTLRHRCARRARRQGGGDCKNLKPCWHRYLREVCTNSGGEPPPEC